MGEKKSVWVWLVTCGRIIVYLNLKLECWTYACKLGRSIHRIWLLFAKPDNHEEKKIEGGPFESRDTETEKWVFHEIMLLKSWPDSCLLLHS